MEFPFRLPTSIGAPPGHAGPYIGCLDDKMLRGMSNNLMTVLDTVGKKSAVAQGLKKPVTYGSASSLIGQRVYLMVEDRRALGLIKVGTKHLFVAPPALHAGRNNLTSVQDALKEISPLCVLDFYVHESCQRTGLGRHLFDVMLEGEGVSPVQLAYDRPSNKLLPFLRKHFGLSRYQPQNNNFVIFDEFYSHKHTPAARGSRSCSVRRGRSSEGAGCDTASQGSRRDVFPGGLTSEPPPFVPAVSSTSGPSMEPSYGLPQRPPLMPFAPASGSTSVLATPANCRTMEPDMFSGSGSSSVGRPPSLGSNSRLPLGAHQGAPSSSASLQTPWATADGPQQQMSQAPRRGGPPSSCSGNDGSFAAGQYARGHGRSASMPSRGHGHARAAGDNPLTGCAFEALPGLAGTNGNAGRRYASPLSHAGSRMLAL